MGAPSRLPSACNVVLGELIQGVKHFCCTAQSQLRDDGLVNEKCAAGRRGHQLFTLAKGTQGMLWARLVARGRRFSDGRCMQSPARRLALSIAAVALAVTALAPSAQARTHHRLRVAVPAFLHFTAQPKYAAIVVDAKTGEVLYEQAPDAHRYPASITKIMTMYLAFEELSQGHLSLKDTLVVSPHAAAQAPSKIGIRQGGTIAVGDAMNAIAVKSANDMAVAMAEKMGGSESHFAEMMTAKAKQLGMNNTQFVNASGLPDTRQLTTARDISILSRAVLRDYPQYYSYFSTREFTWHGQTTKNHNHLLGQMPGVDGIKTGFTNASGFNLAASAVRDNRRLIAVVMGGSSTAARDSHVADLLDAGFIVLHRREEGQATTIAQNLREPAPVGAVDRPPTEQGDGEQAGMHIVVDGKAPKKVAVKADAPADLSCKRVLRHHHRVTRCVKLASNDDAHPVKAQPAVAKSGDAGHWQVQLGAYKNSALARHQLAQFNQKFADALASSEGHVEHSSGNYRVRFAGLSADGAKEACASIKSQGQDCMTLRP
jgi:D-alanyl-D-alanine carboxypeptidase